MSELFPAGLDVALVRAANPSLLTLTGTNTWLVGRDPCWVVDPGPLLDDHVAAVLAEGATRGGIGGIALTHDHPDHADAAGELAARAGGVPVAAARWPGATLRPGEGDAIGPLEAIVLTGHSLDHRCYAYGDACLTGDAVLGAGSVFIAPDPGALAGYLDGLQRLRGRGFAALLPGHGPVVHDVIARLDAYIAHRLDREQALVAALNTGARSADALLAAAWADVPDGLRMPAMVTLFAHLDKLEEEGRIAPGEVRRPDWISTLGGA